MANVEQVAYSLIKEAISKSTSDIHFIPENEFVRVYFRIHGNRTPNDSLSINLYNPLLTFFKFTSGMDIGETKIPQHGTYSLTVHARRYHLRLSTLPVSSGESLAIRIHEEDKIPSIDKLFLFSNQAKTIKQWANERYGLVLITGPTGVGKSTTMYSFLSYATKQCKQIVSIEDPVEQKINGLIQIDVNDKLGLQFADIFKSVLRHDPDIIMIGEIRDVQTAKLAVRAAYSGHLIISTLHAKDGFGTIQRLKEMGIKEEDLMQTLLGVVSQQLILTNNQHIKRVAIAEILQNEILQKAIHGVPLTSDSHFQSFDFLRRKACALGYIRQKDL
ncbi:competence type IV pilus ATPase ComGA [Salirhabdus salicampi]|uniref:competence type IV pilus ATPase ComGA n=1 Tax=Salirhabdus salicampi TaxID=476102 RepID=UPI0020C24009|nr:competence type IV pilus ATPase ComGA [Salirhabdus salicampi]MCP8616846.1 Flp pilus assembly complex ATPase component TadA [Salirhabdus salicampi]